MVAFLLAQNRNLFDGIMGENMITDTQSPSALKLNLPLEELTQHAGDMFSECLHAFRAFGGLSELSQDMRVLSLNAELAAGRAGQYGLSVRALTQYTRQLVARLNSVQDDLNSLRSRVYGHFADALRQSAKAKIFMRISQAAPDVSNDACQIAENQPHMLHAGNHNVGQMLAAIQAMMQCVADMQRHAHITRGVVSQAGSIATNIAIEATSAGQFQYAFLPVANTMQDYVMQLRDATDTAVSALNLAHKRCDAIRSLMRGQQRHSHLLIAA
jgi:methyl-accepting chemotaxis protein